MVLPNFKDTISIYSPKFNANVNYRWCFLVFVEEKVADGVEVSLSRRVALLRAHAEPAGEEIPEDMVSRYSLVQATMKARAVCVKQLRRKRGGAKEDSETQPETPCRPMPSPRPRERWGT